MNNTRLKKYIQVGRLLFRFDLSNKPPNVFDKSGNSIYLLFPFFVGFAKEKQAQSGEKLWAINIILGPVLITFSVL